MNETIVYFFWFILGVAIYVIVYRYFTKKRSSEGSQLNLKSSKDVYRLVIIALLISLIFMSLRSGGIADAFIEMDIYRIILFISILFALVAAYINYRRYVKKIDQKNQNNNIE